jgi:hypothetical protein
MLRFVGGGPFFSIEVGPFHRIEITRIPRMVYLIAEKEVALRAGIVDLGPRAKAISPRWPEHAMRLPQARDLADLNEQLLAACREDERRQIAGRSQLVGAAMIAEREHLLPLVEHGFELAETSFPRVDGLGCVRVRTNLYSVPAECVNEIETAEFRY